MAVDATAVSVGGTAVSAGAVGASVTGTAVSAGAVGASVAGTAVSVGRTGVSVAGTAVSVGGAAVGLGGTFVSVGRTAVGRGASGIVVGGTTATAVGSTVGLELAHALNPIPTATKRTNQITVFIMRRFIRGSFAPSRKTRWTRVLSLKIPEGQARSPAPPDLGPEITSLAPAGGVESTRHSTSSSRPAPTPTTVVTLTHPRTATEPVQIQLRPSRFHPQGGSRAAHQVQSGP